MPIRLQLSETRYVVVSLPPSQFVAALDAARAAPEFLSIIRDEKEVTLILAREHWLGIAAQFPAARAQDNWRMIYFDTVMDFNVVGFIAEISRALAREGISILTVSTYSTDMVLVSENRYEDAVAAVKRALIAFTHTHLSQH
ncbi:MAG: ACT domain-containing protein [Blastocatellia bacterium]